MDRENAIEYLERKERIEDKEKGDTKYSKEDEAEIKEVMKRGKIYGDPVAMCE